MRIRVGYDLQFNVPAPTAMLLLLHVYPQKYILSGVDNPQILPVVPAEKFLDSFGNLCSRLVAQPGTLRLSSDLIVDVDGSPDLVNTQAPQIPIQELPHDTLRYLMASRYCEVEKLTNFAWATFGNTPPGYPRVQAVCDFVHNHLKFGYQFARNTRSAFEAFQEKLGVCRDFTHLAITLCRCLAIPARYTTGYLGDIGVPRDPAPMDFSAWFEAYLGDRWYTFDARHNHPRIGRIVMAYGRDATDAALTTSFGPTTLTSFKVWTDEV